MQIGDLETQPHFPNCDQKNIGKKASLSLFTYRLLPTVGCNFVRTEQISEGKNYKCSPKVGMVLDHAGVVSNDQGHPKLC